MMSVSAYKEPPDRQIEAKKQTTVQDNEHHIIVTAKPCNRWSNGRLGRQRCMVGILKMTSISQGGGPAGKGKGSHKVNAGWAAAWNGDLSSIAKSGTSFSGCTKPWLGSGKVLSDLCLEKASLARWGKKKAGELYRDMGNGDWECRLERQLRGKAFLGGLAEEFLKLGSNLGIIVHRYDLSI